MYADGYIRLPRKLLLSSLTMERQYALAWIVAQASYTEREVAGVTLRVGETPPISLTTIEERFRWTRKAARVFLDYALSPKCAEETGIRIRVGQKVEGHRLGHSEGHRLGHTYLIGLVKVTDGEGHRLGHSEGHRLGHTVKKKERIQEETPPYGGSAEGDDSEKPVPKTRMRRTPTLMTIDWQPNEGNAARAAEWGLDLPRLLDDFRDYWIRKEVRRADWDSTFRNRMIACVDAGMFLLHANGNGRSPVTGQTVVPDDAVAAAIVARVRG